MNIETMTMSEVEARLAEIRELINQDDADLDALNAEVDQLTARREQLREEAEARANLASRIAAGLVGTPIKGLGERREDNNMFGIETLEYRNAWVKNLIHRDVTAEERAALTSASAVIPTMTVNAVWDKLIKEAELLGKVDVSQFPSYVRFPRATTVNAAAAGAVGATISESSDVLGYVDLTPNEYTKLLTVGADIDHMAIDAIHDWIVTNLTKSIRYAINADILVGSGSNALTGISSTVSADSTAIPATVTKASILKIMGALGAAYQTGAIWIMTPAMFYENILTLTQLNDYVINDGFSFRLFGHEVVLMSEALIDDKETIFYGDPSAYKVNIFKPLDVKTFETATTTNLQFRGACLADGELLDANAFVRFAQA